MFCEVPSGSVNEFPWQMEAEVKLDVFGMTVNVVVIALSQPAVFGICARCTATAAPCVPDGKCTEPTLDGKGPLSR